MIFKVVRLYKDLAIHRTKQLEERNKALEMYTKLANQEGIDVDRAVENLQKNISKNQEHRLDTLGSIDAEIKRVINLRDKANTAAEFYYYDNELSDLYAIRGVMTAAVKIPPKPDFLKQYDNISAALLNRDPKLMKYIEEKNKEQDKGISL